MQRLDSARPAAGKFAEWTSGPGDYNDIITGPDGAMWFTGGSDLVNSQVVGRIVMPTAPTISGTPTSPTPLGVRRGISGLASEPAANPRPASV